MRKGENNLKFAGKTAICPTEIMISPPDVESQSLPSSCFRSPLLPFGGGSRRALRLLAFAKGSEVYLVPATRPARTGSESGESGCIPLIDITARRRSVWIAIFLGLASVYDAP
jgi:hypothetical protein